MKHAIRSNLKGNAGYKGECEAQHGDPAPE